MRTPWHCQDNHFPIIDQYFVFFGGPIVMLQPGLFSSTSDDNGNAEKRLLILACSENKKNKPDLIPAIERYDGPMWKMLRSFTKKHTASEMKLDIYVLSAKFGLIPTTESIPWYDQVMTENRAKELQRPTMSQLCMLLDEGYGQICLALSKLYLHALQGWENIIPGEASVTVIDGPMAAKPAQLRSWLNGDVWKPTEYDPHHRIEAKKARSEVGLNGIPIRLSRAEIFEKARVALATGDTIGIDNYRDWCVFIDGRPVSTKWLVKLISGISVDKFDAPASRRVLLGLGIDVERSH
jgi:hypothetical protein